MEFYKILNQQNFENGVFSIKPIRYADRFDIMNWRNEQIYHLRQNRLLTIEDQEHYFQNVISKLFNDDQPSQVLFSFFKNEQCIGYGGLVHINWIDKNAEISFIMNTKLEKNDFSSNWINYLNLIEKVAFNELELHKIYTYAFDLRPHLYNVLLEANYKEDARLKEHCLFDGKYLDVVIHSKISGSVKF